MTKDYLQLGQGCPSGLQSQAFQVALEDQQDLSFLGDLPSQALPFTTKQKQDAHKSVASCSFVGCYFCKSGVAREQEIYICWIYYLGSLFSLSSLGSCRSRGALFEEKKRWQRLILWNILYRAFWHIEIGNTFKWQEQGRRRQHLLSFLVVLRDQTLQWVQGNPSVNFSEI